MATTSNASIARSEKDRAMDEKLLHDYKDPDKRRRRRRNVRIGFCVTFAILLITSLLNWGVVSSWGKVSIDRITLSGSDGASFSGLVYRPDNATDATPAPGIIMLHGNSGILGARIRPKGLCRRSPRPLRIGKLPRLFQCGRRHQQRLRHEHIARASRRIEAFLRIHAQPALHRF